MTELIAHSENDLPFIAKTLIEGLGHSRIVAFDAEMGAGKTTFITVLLKAMGVEHVDGSPTYGFVQSYQSPMFGTIYHFDLYRLESIQEAFDIGFEEYVYSDAYCFIEWPSKAEELLPEETILVEISVNAEGERIFRW